jgi:hypothetical protein
MKSRHVIDPELFFSVSESYLGLAMWTSLSQYSVTPALSRGPASRVRVRKDSLRRRRDAAGYRLKAGMTEGRAIQ